MAAFDFPQLESLGQDDIDRFRRDGFVIVEGLLSADRIAALRERFPKVFAGQFDTGVYPDEWYWREGMSLPDVTRHMANAWKSDLTIAKLALSEDIGRAAARLAGWPGIKLGQDTLWWKPPQTKPIAIHQDSSFMDFLEPPQTITCWVTLDDTHRDAGTLEYVPGSHRWPIADLPDDFFIAEDYRARMKAAARAAGIADPEPIFIEIPAGSCVFHAGEIWHGSGPNVTGDRMRRSIGVHMIRDDAPLQRPAGRLYLSPLSENRGSLSRRKLFPVLWSSEGRRTDWIDGYCDNGRRVPAAACLGNARAIGSAT